MIIILIIVALLVIPFIMALFAAKGYAISRSVTINKPTHEVFEYIRHLQNERYYNKWVMQDPNSTRTERGTDGTLGYLSTWDSQNKNVGAGEEEIIDIQEGRRLAVEVRFIRPFKNVAQLSMTVQEANGNATLLTWTFKGDRNYMMKLMHILLNLQKMLGKDMLTSLNNLKNILERN